MTLIKREFYKAICDRCGREEDFWWGTTYEKAIDLAVEKGGWELRTDPDRLLCYDCVAREDWEREDPD